jgi:hypothetical protein
MIKLHENAYFRLLLVSFIATYSRMPLLHSNICIFIFDPKVDIIRGILLYYVHCVKEKPVQRISLNNHNPKILQTKFADPDDARILCHRFHTNFFMI